jgi:hypothetical protein
MASSLPRNLNIKVMAFGGDIVRLYWDWSMNDRMINEYAAFDGVQIDGKPKSSEKTCISAALSSTDRT